MALAEATCEKSMKTAITIVDRLRAELPRTPDQRIDIKPIYGNRYRVNWREQRDTENTLVKHWHILDSQVLRVVEQDDGTLVIKNVTIRSGS